VTTSRPATVGGDLTEVLIHQYGVEVARLERLPSEVDRVELVTSGAGDRFVLKISIGAQLEPKIRWQHDLLRAAQRADGIRVPHVVPTLDGEELLLLADGGLLRLYSWLEGTPLADLPSHSPTLLHDWGRATAELTNALSAVEPPAELNLSHHWEVLRAREAVDATIAAVEGAQRRRGIETLMGWFDAWAADGLNSLAAGVVHQDLNDFNVLAARDPDGRMRVSGILDFSDALPTAAVADLAVAVAYAMVRKPDPLIAAMHVVAGYVERRSLSKAELQAIYPLAVARLCVNAATWTSRTTEAGLYGRARMRHTWPTIERLARVPPTLASAAIAHAAGAVPCDTTLVHWLSERAGTFAAVLAGPIHDTDLSAASRVFDYHPLGDDTTATIARLAAGGAIAGRHLTSRFSRLTPRATRTGEPPSLHLGVDVWTEGEPPVYAPLDAVVELRSETEEVTVLRHTGPVSRPFWSRWKGISTTLAPSASVKQGQELGSLTRHGTSAVARLNVQLFQDRELALLAPEMVPRSLVPAWQAVSPDPSPLLGIERPDADEGRVDQIRRDHFAASQRAYYEQPIEVVRASGVTFADCDGRTYLDAINNVSHVGHGNPAVIEALERQARRLNTNSRFLYRSLSRYVQRLAACLPEPLEVVFLVCTGSEANDLALRISRQVTGRHDVIVIDGAYHGNTSAVTAISPNRYKGPGGSGPPPDTHEVAMPDRYRGSFGYGDPDAGPKYAADVRRVTEALAASATPPAAFVAESLMGSAGTIVHPDGYLLRAFEHARSAGALCIADEVQVGFGRLGSSFWGFEQQAVTPDIVTMGKPIGNGHPLAAVVTTREIAQALNTGMKYFNTFGGNPVSCEVGLAVLDEIRDRGLQKHAADVGAYFLARLRDLQCKHPAIGDVRGRGLYIGVDLVSDRTTKTPDPHLACRVSEQMKDEGVVVIPTGAADNVLKIKPPMVFTRANADQFVDTLERVLTDRW
jgi:4-aminobutyrate aminotransferase-like enzyme/Ser/Thr protein kinase RdoA (MazF antagonist)